MCPLDSRGRGKMITKDEPIECGGVRVKSGDFILGDIDGVVVIPQDISQEVIDKALHKVEGENIVRDELRQGVSLKEVYQEFQ